MEFSLSIFRFNPKSDYLPYYKKYDINIKEDLTLSDLLELVKKEDIFFDYPKDKNVSILVNNLAVDTNISIKEVYENFGLSLVLEPLSIKRSKKDLIIDTKDFDDTFKLLDGIVTHEDKIEYDKYIKYFYTSPTLKYNPNFQGTSFFIFVKELIDSRPSIKNKILKIISDEHNGIWYHFPLTHKIYPQDKSIEDAIGYLKNEMFKTYPHINQSFEQISKKIATP